MEQSSSMHPPSNWLWHQQLKQSLEHSSTIVNLSKSFDCHSMKWDGHKSYGHLLWQHNSRWHCELYHKMTTFMGSENEILLDHWPSPKLECPHLLSTWARKSCRLLHQAPHSGTSHATPAILLTFAILPMYHSKITYAIRPERSC